MAEELFDKKKRILILVESPEKATTITKIFRAAGYNKVVIQATFGHFTKIADGGGYHNSGIFPDQNFKINYVLDNDPKKSKNTKALKEQVKLADFIYICTDPDREGEAIAQSCVDFLKIPKSKYKRATYQAINQKAIFEAIRNAGSINTNLVAAARTRGALDKGFGYGISEQIRKNGKGKSGGRVQSAALKMIVDRENEILNFVPEKYIDLYLHFFKNNAEFKAKYVGTDKKPVKRLDTQEQVDKIYEECKGNPFIVKSVEHKDKFENPRPPFCTATFQQECAGKLGLTVEQAQDCAQKLFDAGKISYHRTDSEIFEGEFEAELKSFVKNNYPKAYVSGSVVKGKNDENAQEGHEALHVLDLNLTPELYAKEAPNELLSKVYRIIYNRTIATALKPAIIAQTTYNIYNKLNKFVLNSNELKFDGYRCVYAYREDSDPKDDVVKETFEEGEQLQHCKFESVPKETTPPARYKESSFVPEMKKAGIGRPSTYSSTIKTLKSESRGYCVVENKYLKPTELGMKNIEFLSDNFGDVVNVDYTKEMEKSLDLIAQGKLDNLEFLKEFFEHLDESIKKVSPEDASSSSSKVCPECGSPMKIRKGPYGVFWGCTNYPKCKHIENIKKRSE